MSDEQPIEQGQAEHLGDDGLPEARAILDAMIGTPIASVEMARDMCAEMHRACRIAVVAVAAQHQVLLADPDDIGACGRAFKDAGLRVLDDAAFWDRLTDHATSRGRPASAGWQTVEDGDDGFLWDLADEVVQWAEAQLAQASR